MQKNPGQQGPLGEESPQSSQNIPGTPQREKRISTKQEGWCAAYTDWKTKRKAWRELIPQHQHSSSNHTPLENPESKTKTFSYLQRIKKSHQIWLTGRQYQCYKESTLGIIMLAFPSGKIYQWIRRRDTQRSPSDAAPCRQQVYSAISSPAGHFWHLSAWLSP